MTNVHFSSATDEWSTPQDLYNSLNDIFHFDLDVCASTENAKCPRYFNSAADGLKQQWSGVCWMNPPYGRHIKLWIRKAWESSQTGAVVVCLVPARTDTAWWHNYVARGEVWFLRGRIKFGGQLNPAPFPSAVVIFQAGRDQATSYV